MFQLSNEDYFIEPLEGVLAQPGRAQPHVVYKRQDSKTGAEDDHPRSSGTCGVHGMLLCLQLQGRGWAQGTEVLSRSFPVLSSPWTKGTRTDQQTHGSLCPPSVPRPEASVREACPSPSPGSTPFSQVTCTPAGQPVRSLPPLPTLVPPQNS